MAASLIVVSSIPRIWGEGSCQCHRGNMRGNEKKAASRAIYGVYRDRGQSDGKDTGNERAERGKSIFGLAQRNQADDSRDSGSQRSAPNCAGCLQLYKTTQSNYWNRLLLANERNFASVNEMSPILDCENMPKYLTCGTHPKIRIGSCQEVFAKTGE